MIIDFHRNFDRRFAKLTLKRKGQFKLRLMEFIEDPYRTTLNNHSLKGKYQGYRSINIAGDLRAVFIHHSDSHVEFVDIGSHSQLYK